ncbi:hypothetical protein H6770_04815 [Candidatus Peribacteria bacterium]|nr:hypothetical protein [Candidatus Peribacteria bacterium]
MKKHYIVGGLIALLLGKFLYPLFTYDVPLGYDPGIYRYLFIQYADALRSLSLPNLAPWAQEYPRTFYLFIAPFIIAGIPVDAFIGWMWNLVPVALACVLAWVTAKRSNTQIGIAVLLMAFLSQAYYDGFFAMYMKVYVSLIFVVLTYYFVERLSVWFPITALLAVLIHQQTGLVLVVALGVWWVIQLPSRFSEPRFRVMTTILAGAACVGLLMYLPQWERAILSPLKSIFLLRGASAPGGAFPDAIFYIKTMPIVLLLGIGGYLTSMKTERGSLWQLSVLVCLIFVTLHLTFYKRFFLLLDFFLLPYAAAFLVSLWNMLKHSSVLRGSLALLILAQCLVGLRVVSMRTPAIRSSDIMLIHQAAAALPEHASIIALENISSTWLRGWIPYRNVGAPGLFDFPGWTIEEWGQFIDGSNADRKALLQRVESESLYLFASPLFTEYYGERANPVLRDPCLKKVDNAPLLQFICNT